MERFSGGRDEEEDAPSLLTSVLLGNSSFLDVLRFSLESSVRCSVPG